MENKELLEQLISAMHEQTEVLANMVHDAEVRINIKIENEVTKKIESLFDGYKLVHEQQWELQRKVDTIERRLEALEIRVG